MILQEKLKEISLYYEKGNLLLFKEGNFWRAYEQSALLFTLFLKKYSLIKRHFKGVGADVVFLGFPDNSLEKILEGKECERLSPTKIGIILGAVDTEDSLFQDWKKGILLTEPTLSNRMTYDNLPVFKEVYDLLLYVYQINQNVNREYKYSLTENIKRNLLELLTNIYRTNDNLAKSEKVIIMENAFINAVQIKLQLRLLYDLKQINLKKFTIIAETISGINKQLTGWHNKLKKSLE